MTRLRAASRRLSRPSAAPRLRFWRLGPSPALQTTLEYPDEAALDSLRPPDVKTLQRTAGNRAVQRLLDAGRPALPNPGGGQPLPKPLAAQMGRAFSADLSGVRVSESPAVASLGARAVTQGDHIHFAPGELRPGTSSGQKLLGHELTHVMQQRAAGQAAPQAKLSVNINSRLENEADRLGALAAQGRPIPQLQAGGGVTPAAGAQLMLVGEVVSLAVSAGVALGTLLGWALDRGWAYALGETQKAKSQAKLPEEGAPPVISSVEKQKQAFIRTVIEHSGGQIDATGALALYEQQVQSDLEDRDEVTGFVGGAQRKPTLDNALAHVRRHPQAAAFYVEADVRNLGGLNAHLGHSGANVAYRQMAQTAERHLRRLPGEVHAFRHGGDEISFVVVGLKSSLTASAIRAALTAADLEIAAYTQSYTFLSVAPYARGKRLALTDIPHAKYQGKSGIGLIWAATPADPGASGPDAVITLADQLVEARKKIAGEFSAPDPLYTLAPTAQPSAPTGDTAFTTTTSTLVKLAWSAGIEMTTLVRWAWDKGWEYAYDQVLKYSDVNTAAAAFVSSAERQKEEFLHAAVLMSRGQLTRAEALTLYDQDVRAFVEARDVVTGFQGQRHRLPTVRNALAYVEQNPEARAFYIEADVRNLSGLNAHLGHNNADEVYQRLAQTAETRLRGLAAQVYAFRHGGDEISFVVVGLKDDFTLADVEAALASAARENASYAAGANVTSIAPETRGQRLKLKDVPHPKYKNQRGTGLIHAVAEILSGTKDYLDIVRAAEELVESRKIGVA